MSQIDAQPGHSAEAIGQEDQIGVVVRSFVILVYVETPPPSAIARREEFVRVRQGRRAESTRGFRRYRSTEVAPRLLPGRKERGNPPCLESRRPAEGTLVGVVRSPEIDGRPKPAASGRVESSQFDSDPTAPGHDLGIAMFRASLVNRRAQVLLRKTSLEVWQGREKTFGGIVHQVRNHAPRMLSVFFDRKGVAHGGKAPRRRRPRAPVRIAG